MNYTKFWGVGEEALAPPDLGRNKNKVFPLKNPFHKSTFQKKRSSFHSSENRTNRICSAEKALAPPDIGRKRSKVTSLKRPKTKGQPSTLADKNISKEESEERINIMLISATIILN